MFIFLFVLFILLVACLPWVAVLQPPSKPAWLMALYLIASAIVVLSGYITNSLHVLNQRWAMLGAHLLIGGLGWLVWKRVGSPSPWEPFREWQARLDLQWLRRQPALALLALGITVSY